MQVYAESLEINEGKKMITQERRGEKRDGDGI